MIVRRLLLSFAVLLCTALAGAPAAAGAWRGACVTGQPGPPCSVWTAKVRTIGDADTIDVDVRGDGTRATRRIRFTGVQAMEQTAYSPRHRVGECHAVEATVRLEAMIRRSRGVVRLSALDPESRSRGRLLRHVGVKVRGRWRDVATALVNEGLALWLPSPREWAGNRFYGTLTQAALAAGRGLFDPDACGAGPASVSPLALRVNWDADGTDTANPTGEWVDIRNLDPVNAVGLGGWYVRDSGLRRYTFPAHAAIPPGGEVTLNVGADGEAPGPAGTVFGWGLNDPVFENASPGGDERAIGDGAYLFDPLGNVRAAMVYPCRGACVDPAQGAVGVSADFRGRREAITLTNLTAGPVDLTGYLLKSPPQTYHLGAGTVLPPGGALTVRVTGDPADDEPLLRFWGFAKPILRDAGDVARLATYSDITIACTAWGDRGC